MKMRRSYLRGMSDGASPKGIPVLQPPALRIWPLQQMSTYELKQASNFDEALTHLGPSAISLPGSDMEKSAQNQSGDHERLPLERGKSETKPLSGSLENTVERESFHLSAASTQSSWKFSSELKSGNEPQRREEFDVEVLEPTEPMSAPESRRELKRKKESSPAVLTPPGFYFAQTEAMSSQESRLKPQGESATASPVWERADVENKVPKSTLRKAVKPSPDRRLEPQSATDHNERQSKRQAEARLGTADQPEPAPRTPLRKLTPEERSSGAKTSAYAPSYKEGHEQRGARNSVRIGTIEIHVAPAPPAPAPRPVVWQSPTSPAPVLARGFTSQFGFRQG
jgi:hypothetical protein